MEISELPPHKRDNAQAAQSLPVQPQGCNSTEMAATTSYSYLDSCQQLQTPPEVKGTSISFPWVREVALQWEVLNSAVTIRLL